jgi:hypothetical protein
MEVSLKLQPLFLRWRRRWQPLNTRLCEPQSQSDSYRDEKNLLYLQETNLDSCYPSRCFDAASHLKGDSSLILSDANKIVFDVEGKRGNFLFGCVRRAVHLKKSETMREYRVTVLIYRKWKSCLILRTSYF